MVEKFRIGLALQVGGWLGQRGLLVGLGLPGSCRLAEACGALGLLVGLLGGGGLALPGDRVGGGGRRYKHGLFRLVFLRQHRPPTTALARAPAPLAAGGHCAVCQLAL